MARTAVLARVSERVIERATHTPASAMSRLDKTATPTAASVKR